MQDFGFEGEAAMSCSEYEGSKLWGRGIMVFFNYRSEQGLVKGHSRNICRHIC